MHFLKYARALGAVVLLASIVAPTSAAQALPADSPPVLRPGDIVKIAVWRNPELSGDILVAADGTLQHPLYQAIHVAQTPLDSVTSRIGAFLSQYTTSPQFVVQPQFRIIVRGEVRNPAVFTVPLETTLGAAIAIAGGPSETAQLKKVTLVRDGHTYRLDFTDPASPWTALPIRSGDQLIIGRKSNLFFGTILPLITASAAIASVISVLTRR